MQRDRKKTSKQKGNEVMCKSVELLWRVMGRMKRWRSHNLMGTNLIYID
jgi:hypothetical protein